jgi:hypothetical protein
MNKAIIKNNILGGDSRPQTKLNSRIKGIFKLKIGRKRTLTPAFGKKISQYREKIKKKGEKIFCDWGSGI